MAGFEFVGKLEPEEATGEEEEEVTGEEEEKTGVEEEIGEMQVGEEGMAGDMEESDANISITDHIDHIDHMDQRNNQCQLVKDNFSADLNYVGEPFEVNASEQELGNDISSNSPNVNIGAIGDGRIKCEPSNTLLSNIEESSDRLLDVYFCDHCDYVSEKELNLKVHLKRTHKHLKKKSEPEEIGFECNACAYICYNKNTLRMHRRRHHGGVKPVKIEAVVTRKPVNIETVETGVNIFNCDKCEYSCIRKDTLRMHKQRKHSKKRN